MQALAPYKKQLKQAAYAIGRLIDVSPGNLAEGVEICRVLHSHEIAATLGKFSKAGDDPAQIVHEYQLASNSLRSAPFYLSVKPPALDFDLCHAAAITDTAILNGHGIHFDSHEHVQADQTMQLLQDVMAQHASAKGAGGRWRYGVTLPSRWKRSMADARWVAEKGYEQGW